MPLHHVAYATRDVEATTHFYEDLMGFPLIHTELQAHNDTSWVRHVFYDIGGGECIAFFQFQNVGEKPDWTPDVSDGVGLPGVGEPLRVRRHGRAAGSRARPA